MYDTLSLSLLSSPLKTLIPFIHSIRNKDGFFFFFMFLLLTYCDVWLCHRTIVALLVGFHVCDSDSSVVSIRQISHIKSMFFNMLH